MKNLQNSNPCFVFSADVKTLFQSPWKALQATMLSRVATIVGSQNCKFWYGVFYIASKGKHSFLWSIIAGQNPWYVMEGTVS